jgi:hypothetical protein
MERLVGKVLNIVDGGTIEVEIAPLPPRVEVHPDSGAPILSETPAISRSLPRIERIRLAGRGPTPDGTIENELAEIALQSRLLLKRVELDVVSREGDGIVCELRKVG